VGRKPFETAYGPASRQTVTVIPVRCPVVIEVVRAVGDSGVTESDVIRWFGVAVAVAGVVLATPDGTAAAWRSAKNWHRRVWARARRLMRRPGHVVGPGGVVTGKMTLSGRAHAERWQPWQEDAADEDKIDILHKQIDILHEQIAQLRTQAGRTADDLEKEIREAEGRVDSQLRQLASEMRGERSQASRVDARGFGPIEVFSVTFT
jgi:hypothetical protein